jgi:hypothetical protein
MKELTRSEQERYDWLLAQMVQKDFLLLYLDKGDLRLLRKMITAELKRRP